MGDGMEKNEWDIEGERQVGHASTRGFGKPAFKPFTKCRTPLTFLRSDSTALPGSPEVT